MKTKAKITRKQAVKEGKPKYYTGFPCKHGHISERYTSTYVCQECMTQRVRIGRDRARAIRAEKEAGNNAR